jgi:hypothetical protein
MAVAQASPRGNLKSIGDYCCGSGGYDAGIELGERQDIHAGAEAGMSQEADELASFSTYGKPRSTADGEFQSFFDAA